MRTLHGVSASPGVAIGQALVLGRAVRHADTVTVTNRSAEADRARHALEQAASDLERLAAGLRDAGRPAEADVVDTGVLMAMDPELITRVETLILDSGLYAADALREATEQTALELSRLPDPTLALRADDVRSLGRRAAAHVEGDVTIAAGGVLIADTLGPADVAELAPSVNAIALAAGGITSHAAIVARSLGLPMVVGAGAELLEVEDGEEVLVDGDHGAVLREPDAEQAAEARTDVERRHSAREIAIARRLEPAKTRDGRRVRVLANASTAAELEEATGQGAEGVGLMRTELLFLEATAWPSYERQVEVFRPVLARLEDQTATVRLFDFGGDKTPPFLSGIVKRGIDVLLDEPDALRAHVKAVVDAGRGTRLRILVPMVSSASQLIAVREAVGSGPLVGAMIETPEAASAPAEIAQASDFLSIGTNDLTQLVLGLDREQSRRAPVMNPRVLILIDATVRAGHAARIDVDVCGEAASDPAVMPILIGLGVDELSVAAARVGLVRQLVRELDFVACEKEAEKLLHQAGHASRQRV